MRTGVYILLLNRTVVYVGATRNWPNRLTQHKEIDFTDARLIECSDKLLFETEKRLIKLFKPKFNKQHHLKITRKPVSEWVKNNPEKVREAFLNRTIPALAESLKRTLGYSEKTTSSDIGYVLVRHYSLQNNVHCDWETRKIKKLLVKETKFKD